MVLSAGDDVPDFSIEAAVSGKTISKGALDGRRLVLVFHGPKTQDAPKVVGKAVRAQHGSADDVVVANVVNLKAMGGMWKKIAEAQIKQTYQKMAGKITVGDPADYVVICPDWDNAVGPSFGVGDSDREPAVVVIDDGKVVGSAQGKDGLDAAALDALS